MKTKITRKDISDRLIQWQNGALTREEIYSWVEGIYFPSSMEFDDWEGDEDNSVSNEILSRLDMLFIDNYSKEAISAFIDFLNTPIGQFETGYNEFIRRIGESV